MSTTTANPAEAPPRPTLIRESVPSRIFDVVNIAVLIGFALLTLIPFVYVAAGSLASEAEITQRGFFLWPNRFVTDAYAYIFSTNVFVRSMAVTIGVTVVGTVLQLGLTLLMAYPLSRRELPGRNIVLNMVIFTMVFGGGLIPTYLIVRSLGMLDTYWALIVPGAVSAFNLIVIKNFFQELPEELQESAKIDGCTEIGVFTRIVLPLSKPIIATFALFHAVAIWNDYLSPLLYISDSAKWTLQMFVRQVTLSSDALQNLDPNYIPPEQGLKFAVSRLTARSRCAEWGRR